MFKKIIVLLSVLTIISTMLCGCVDNETQIKGELYDLNEVYENGGITRQDLLSILYYIYDLKIDENKDKYPEDFVPTPKNPSELDKKTQDAIARLYKQQNGYSQKYAYRLRYYGKYGEYFAFKISVLVPGADYSDYVEWITVGDVGYWWGPGESHILLYRE